MEVIMKARGFIALCVIFTIAITGCGGKSKPVPVEEIQPAQAPEAWNPQAIAIYPFDVRDSKSKLSGIEVTNLLTNRLLDVPGLKIVEREELERILSELGLAVSDLTNNETQLAIGKLLNAHYFVFGTTNKAVSLMTVKVVQTETGLTVTGLDALYNDDVKSVQAFAPLLQAKLATLPSTAQRMGTSTGARTSEVEVTGIATVIDDDLAEAKTLALKDAYAKAIEQGSGVKLVRETQIENFQLVRDKIFTESVGYVAAYDILRENSDPPVYEVDVRAVVSRAPLSDVEKLELLVKYLFGKPKVVVFVDGEAGGTQLSPSRVSVIEGLIISRLQRAGFSVLDAQTVAERKKELAASPDDEEAARLGSLLDAQVVIRGSFSTNVSDRIEEVGGKKLLVPVITATTTGTFRVVNAETADILYTHSHENLLERSAQKGTGTTESAAVAQSLENFVKSSADGLIIGFAGHLGDPVQLQLQVEEATLAEAEAIEAQIEEMPEQVVVPPTKDLVYQDEIATYEVRTPSKKRFQKKLQKAQPQLIPIKSEFTTVVMRFASDEPTEAGNQDTQPVDVVRTPTKPPTGIIIDTTGLGLKKVTYPKVYYRSENDELTLLYGSDQLNRPTADVEVWATWLNDVEAAKATANVRGNPLVIRATMLENKAVIVRAQDAQKINALEAEHRLLQQGLVVIVHD